MENKIFEIKADGETFIVCAKTEGEASIHVIEQEDVDKIDCIKEVQNTEWDSKYIRLFKNDETFYITYTEAYSYSENPETIGSTLID